MQTALTAKSRPSTAQLLRAPTTETNFQFPENSDLTYVPFNEGMLVTAQHRPISWLLFGWAGSRSNPKRCTFIDVCFPALTTGQQGRITGLMMDSESFDTLPEAVDFVERSFAYGGLAT